MSERPDSIDDKLKQRAIEAAQQLQEKLASDPDLHRLGNTLLLSYRLAYWLISEICSFEGMTNEMAQWLIQAQDMKAKNSFNFLELMKDIKKTMSWLESRERELLARNKTLKKRAKAMVAALRRKDIQLPFHSMTKQFDDDGFQHGDDLVVLGPRAALADVLRYCSHEYKRAGGRAVFLSTSKSKEPETFADTVISADGWWGAGDIVANVNALLEPIIRRSLPKPVGLIVVEDLERLVPEAKVPMSKLVRMRQAIMTLLQHQVDNGYAMIVGVPTDDDADDFDANYPAELLTRPRVLASLQESTIIGGEPSVVVGNDVVRVSDIQKKLKEET